MSRVYGVYSRRRLRLRRRRRFDRFRLHSFIDIQSLCAHCPSRVMFASDVLIIINYYLTVYIYIHIHIYTHTYTYICIYMFVCFISFTRDFSKSSFSPWRENGGLFLSFVLRFPFFLYFHRTSKSCPGIVDDRSVLSLFLSIDRLKSD